MSSLVSRTFDALKKQGALSTSTAVAARDLEVEGMDKNDDYHVRRVSTALHSLFHQRPLYVGRVGLVQQDGGTRYKYFHKRDSLPLTANGRMKQRRRRNGRTVEQATPSATNIDTNVPRRAARVNGAVRVAPKGEYKVRIDGPEMIYEGKVAGSVAAAVMQLLIK